MAQSPGTWQAFPSLRTINALVFDDSETIWAATQGGILKYDQQTISEFTTQEGLSRPDSRSISYDPVRDQIFVGYINGLIDVLNIQTNDISVIEDIERASNFTSKGINDIIYSNDKVYAATDFGIVVINAAEYFVIESFLQVGDISRGTSVIDLYINNDTLYVATAAGIGVGDLNTDLSINSNWISYNASNGFEDRVVESVISFEGKIYASTSDANFVFDRVSWQQNTDYGSDIVIDYMITNAGLIALAESRLYIGNISNTLTDVRSTMLLTNPDEPAEIYFGTQNNGIGSFNTEDNSLDFVVPEGPFLNLFTGLSLSEDILISGSTQRSSLDFRTDQARGYYIFRDNEWFNYNQLTVPLLRSTNFRQVLRTAETQNYYYFGSWGQGIARHDKSTDDIYVFNETNSTLRGWAADNENFPVMSGLYAENSEEMWAVSRFGSTPLYYQQEGDDDWLSFTKNPSVNNSDEYFGLFIDSNGNKWISLQSTTNSGTGLLVLDTGDPTDPADDRGEKLTSSPGDGNLPNEQVKSVIEDLNNEVWIGTERGIARFIFPELIIGGGPGEKNAQWLINADTSASSRFLLRDINVSSMAVNDANEKWVGSVNQGIYVLNEDGSEIIMRFTEENSPLISDNIESIAISDITGEVFIATDQGLQSYQGVSLRAENDMKNLKVFPNPFAYSKNDQIFVEGLSASTTIRVMSIDGNVFNEFPAQGGRTSWDGRDFNGNSLGSGVYFIVALSEDGEEKGIGKVVIIR